MPDYATSPPKAFVPIAEWQRLPSGRTFCGDATSVAVDSDDNVYVFNRGPEPVMVFDADGALRTTWGAGEFDRPHGIAIDDNDCLYLVDDAGHVVQKRTREGELLLEIGTRGRASDPYSGRPFNHPTDIAIDESTGDLFVSDGYYNAAVHRFNADGVHLLSWGEPGTDPGQFCCPHGISMVGTDRVVVCDRENFRLQLFTTDGEFVAQWHAFHPTAIRQWPRDGGHLYMAEMGPPALQHGVPNLGNRIVVLDAATGSVVTRFGAGLPGQSPDRFLAPHGLAVDAEGSVYVAEVARSYSTLFLGEPEPETEPVSLRKWVRTRS